MSTFLGNRLQAPVPAMLIGMLFRMGLPLVGLIVLPKLGGPFADGGLTATILGTYLVGLIVETVLSLRLVPRPGATRATA